MWEFLHKLFDTSDFPARWHCGSWTSAHGWMHVGADVAIFLAYMALPIVMLGTLTKRKTFKFPKTVWLFGAFIFFCGITHLVESMIFWFPMYRLSAVFKIGTALASWATVFALIPSMRNALRLRSPEQLEDEVDKRTFELESQKATLETMLHNSKHGVVLVNAKGEIELTNHAAKHMFGLKELKLHVGKSVYNDRVYRRDKKTLYKREQLPVMRAALKGEHVTDEVLLVKAKDGSSFLNIRASAEPIVFEDKRTGAVASYVDTTELTNANVELSRSNKSLEQFAYVVSHDLTEPVRQISHFSSLLKEECEGQLGEDGKNYLKAMSGSSERMRSLVESLLTYSRLTRTGATANNISCNVENMLNELKQDFQLRINEKNATVATHGDFPTLYVDEEKLKQVFSNLLSNALKFSVDDSIKIDIRVSKGEGAYLFEVKDNGIGIEARFHEQIFLVFKRLHTKEEFPGTGIGLAICKQIVENFGGEMWLSSELGKGTSFYFTIPE